MQSIFSAILVSLCFVLPAFAQEEDLLPLYEGSNILYDDNMGFSEYPFLLNDSTYKYVEGNKRRVFCTAPEGRSPLEITRNYESAIRAKGGNIIYQVRSPHNIRIEGKRVWDYFADGRLTHSGHWSQMQYGSSAVEHLLTAIIETAEVKYYFALATGRDRAGNPVFEFVIIEAQPMELGKVSMDMITDGIESQGRVAIYDLFFDTGKSELKEESNDALAIIANYLNENNQAKFLIVGHTDNVGGLTMNLDLSKNRALSVVNSLVADYGVNKEQLTPMGVGPASPVISNSTEEGKARNRRVEIVAL